MLEDGELKARSTLHDLSFFTPPETSFAIHDLFFFRIDFRPYP
jgi:hypothetical protein